MRLAGVCSRQRQASQTYKEVQGCRFVYHRSVDYCAWGKSAFSDCPRTLLMVTSLELQTFFTAVDRECNISASFRRGNKADKVDCWCEMVEGGGASRFSVNSREFKTSSRPSLPPDRLKRIREHFSFSSTDLPFLGLRPQFQAESRYQRLRIMT